MMIVQNKFFKIEYDEVKNEETYVLDHLIKKKFDWNFGGIYTCKNNFGITTSRYINNMEWHHCRETVLHRAGEVNFNISYLYYWMTGDKTEVIQNISNLANFLNDFENKLKINCSRIEICTKNPAIIRIELNSFWKEHYLRFSLLLGLIRAGKFYDGNFETCLSLRKILNPTRPAIEKFLEGNVNFHPSPIDNEKNNCRCGQGWNYHFCRKRNLDLLIK